MIIFWDGLLYTYVFCIFVIKVISHFVFEARILVLIELVPGHNLHFTF